MTELEAAMLAEPDLCSMGLRQAGRPDDFETNRADLFRHEQAFAACVEWLAAQRRRKTINRRRTSYGLKHDVERAYTLYVPDGILIAAAIHLGIKYARCKNDTTSHLAISG